MTQALNPVSWEAEEYIVKGHNFLWYLGLFVIGGLLATLAILFNSISFLILIIVSIITILFFTFRPPRKIKYTLDKDGLREGKLLHPYSNFRAFGILKEENHYSAVLIPKKRLSLAVKVYFPGGSGEAIVDALGARLPMEEVKLDFLDKIVNFLRI